MNYGSSGYGKRELMVNAAGMDEENVVWVYEK